MQRGHHRMSHPTYPYPFSSLRAFAPACIPTRNTSCNDVGGATRHTPCIEMDRAARSVAGRSLREFLFFSQRLWVSFSSPYRVFSNFVQTAPLLALLTAVAMKAMPMTPSSTVGKSTSLGIGLPATSASIARAASR
jgi:hypothetical protein